MLSNNLWWVPLVAGLEDAVNPCVLISCVCFILWFGWLAQRPLGRGKYVFVFMALVYFLSLSFNIGIAQGILYAPQARQLIHAAYLFLGIVSIALGLIFIRDWRCLIAGQQDLLSQAYWQKGNCSPRIAWVITVVLGLVLSCLASIWPMNYYMGVIGNNILMPGQFWSTVLLMAVYTAFALIPLYLMLALMRLRTSNARFFYAISAAIFIAGGVGAVYIFK